MELNQEVVIGSVFEKRLNQTPERNQYGHVRGLQFLRQNSTPSPSSSPTFLKTKKQKDTKTGCEQLEKEASIKALQETNAKQNEANEGLQAELEALKLKWEESNKTNQTLGQQVEQQREAIATETAQNQKKLNEKEQALCALKTDYDRAVRENSELEKERERLDQKNAEMEFARLKKESLIKELQEINAQQIKTNESLQAELEALKLKGESLNQANQALQQQVAQQGEEIANKTSQEKKQLDENGSLKKQLDEKKQEVEALKEELNRVAEENKTQKARIEALTQDEATTVVKIRQNLIHSIAGQSVTETVIRQAELTATEVLEILSKLGGPSHGQTPTGTLLTAKKAQAVLVLQNSIQNFKLKDLLEFKALIDAKKQENTVDNYYSFIRQEQSFFRFRYGNTKTWEAIMGLVKNKLREDLQTRTDLLTEDQKTNVKAIFQTHRKHGYGFGFFSTPKIPPGVEAKLAATTPSIN